MTKEEFARELASRVSSALDGVRIRVTPVMKLNGVELIGLSIERKDSIYSPVLYCESYYESFCDGMSMDAIAEEIVRVYKRCEKETPSRKLDFLEFEQCRDCIKFKLVNTEKNKSYAVDKPHRLFLDLTLLYYIDISDKADAFMGITIGDGLIEKWGKTEEELYKIAWDNTFMMDNLNAIALDELIDCIDDDIPVSMIVVTNKERHFGATSMLCKEWLDEVGKILESDFYVLPSSIHEVIAVPCLYEEDIEHYHETVRYVNQTTVEAEEFLSDTVYKYSLSDRNLTIC